MGEFIHRCTPPGASPAPNPVELTTQEVEDAGIWEVLQAPGAALGSWAIFGALLAPGHTDFVFSEPLGRSREVKTALSGLFGRFVARAYATRYLGYRFYDHIFDPPMVLSQAPHGKVKRTAHPGRDLPDWAALKPNGEMAIIEAKGCHDDGGPSAALKRAFNQTQRAEIEVAGKAAPFKRFAIATRWGVVTPKPTSPMIYVRDPEADADFVSSSELEALQLGMIRRHFAAFLRSASETKLATAILGLVENPNAKGRESSAAEARARVDSAQLTEARRDTGPAPEDALIGCFITLSGPVGPLTRPDREVLARIGLRPAFVGVERSTIRAAIDGDLPYLVRKRAIARDPDHHSPTDEIGGWIIRAGVDDIEVI